MTTTFLKSHNFTFPIICIILSHSIFRTAQNFDKQREIDYLKDVIEDNRSRIGLRSSGAIYIPIKDKNYDKIVHNYYYFDISKKIMVIIIMILSFKNNNETRSKQN